MQWDKKLVMMANQIARNVRVQGEDRAVAAIAEHLARFWDPRMRAAITAHVAAGAAGLDPLARAAVERLAEGSPA